MSGAWSRTTAPSPQQNGPTSEVQTNPVTAGPQCSELAISQTPTNGQSDGQALQTPELSHSVCAMWLWGSLLWERNPRIPKTLSFICPGFPGCLQKSTEVDTRGTEVPLGVCPSQKSPASCAATSPRVKNPRVAGGPGGPRVTPIRFGSYMIDKSNTSTCSDA